MTDAAEEMDDRALAGEYALGLMSGAEAGRFEARLAAEPALARLVADWREGLAVLADEVDPLAPPASLKAAVEARLFPTPQTKRRGLGFRRVIGGLALVAGLAIGLIFVAPDMLRTPGFAPTHVAQVVAEDQSLVVAVAFDGQSLRLDRQAGQAAPGRALELWAIIGDAAPVSLGVLPDGQQGVVTVPATLRDDIPRAILAISDEPPGGSPTDAPSGAVLATGAVGDA